MSTMQILEQAAKAKTAVALLSEKQKNDALLSIAQSLEECAPQILQANEQDIKAAKGSISDVMLDRLLLTEQRIKAMAQGVRDVAALSDPVGEVSQTVTRPDGLQIKKITVPLGVVAIIYESRPNVTSDAAALCLKSGNACVLRAGKEAHGSAQAIVCAMQLGLQRAGVVQSAISLVQDTSRNSALELMTANGKVDLLIPRGGAGLIKACVQNATVPCIETGTGICHTYVHGAADQTKALKIIENAKCSRPSVCNATEVCLVDRQIAAEFLPKLYKTLVAGRAINPVTMVLCPQAYNVLGGLKGCVPAGENDFDTEFLDYKLAVKVVEGINEALAHIAKHSTHHSECIITDDKLAADKFTREVDSAAVYVNASTRFTDGGEFGLGCEMGISTQKLHARGPMGLKELTTYKYVIFGNGNIR